MTECIVVGGGLIGMLTARELARAGVSVTLLERARAGREASWAGGGILSPLYPWRYADPVSRLAAWSQQHYAQLADELWQESGVDPEWTLSGLLILEEREYPEAEAWARRFATELHLLQGDAVRGCEPVLGEPPDGAIWMPGIAQVRNPRMARALEGSVRACGVDFREGVEVTGLRVQDARVTGVRTADGDLDAESVVVAGGAWSADLLAGLGLRIEVTPVRGQMILIRAEPDLVHRIVLAEGHYVIPRRDGRVLVGSTLEYVGFVKETTPSAVEDLKQVARKLVPDLGKFPVEHHWAGLRPGSPTGVPFIGEFREIKGLFVNAGHFRNGVVLGPASARLLADLLLGRQPIIDPEPYRPVPGSPQELRTQA